VYGCSLVSPQRHRERRGGAEKKSKLNQYLVVACIVSLSPSFAAAQTKTDDKKFLDDTRSAYSMLRRQGLTEINATVIPNWQLILSAVPADRKPEAVKLASKLRFSLFADSSGKVQVKHRVVGPKLTGRQVEALKTIASGVELSVTGFLMSWVPFMMTHVIPDKLDQFVLQNLKDEYLLTYQEGGIDIAVLISKDFVITELRTVQGGVKPLLTRTRDGFVLTGYEGINENPVVGKVVLKAKIESAPVAGMLLPKSVSLEGSAANTPINIKFSFTNYRLKTSAVVQSK